MNESMRLIISAEASEWFVANREGSPNVFENAAFARWLRTSPLHVEEYLAISQLANELGAARDASLPIGDLIKDAALAGADIATPAFSRRPPHKHLWRRGMVPVTAAAALIVVAAIALSNWRPWEWRAEHFATAHGQQLTYRLADNSILRLNTDTSVVVRYGAQGRVVEIANGQAMFEVVHDARRPFRVAAGAVEIRDLGTAFDVYRQGAATRVTVVDGEVDVAQALAAAATAASGWAVRVRSGQQVQVVAGVLTRGPQPVDVSRNTAWLRRQVAFDSQPLGEVAAEFNRYNSIPIQIRTPALRNLTVSGVFAADDTESFIAFLRSLDGVRVEVTSAAIVVQSR